MAEVTLTPYLECGRVINTHGCRGGIKVEPWADSPADLCRLGHLFLRRGADMLPLTVRRASVMKGPAVAAFVREVVPGSHVTVTPIDGMFDGEAEVAGDAADSSVETEREG